MALPGGIGAIDLMLAIGGGDQRGWYEKYRPLLRDRESLEQFEMPAQYLFKNLPKDAGADDRVAATVAELDRFGIERAMIGIDDGNEAAHAALTSRPDRFFASYECDPNRGMEELRKMERLKRDYDIRAVTAFPSGLFPQTPIDDAKFYPVFAKCVELDIPICPCMGVPGPRFPMAPQHVERLDQVCWFFPELRIVMRHGCEPWQALAVKLMLKWPGLHYMTSAFAPKHYPRDIIEFANTRGADKILYAGYYPMGLSLERIFRELPEVPFRPQVWPKFLRNNALRVFKLEGEAAAA